MSKKTFTQISDGLNDALDAVHSATDEEIANYDGWLDDNFVQALIARVRIEREQAIRECAEELQTMARDVRNGGNQRLSFSIASMRVLSLLAKSEGTGEETK